MSADPGRDAGFTLVELVVALSIMATALALFGAGIGQIYSTARATEALTVAASQSHTAFLRLDREIRYAAGISVPAQVDGDWYVEYATTAAGEQTCHQVRIGAAPGVLQIRDQRGAGEPGPWNTLASGVASPSSFSRTGAATGGSQYQQLTVALTLRAGPDSGRRRSAGFTFTALNTTVDTASDAVCAGMGRG